MKVNNHKTFGNKISNKMQYLLKFLLKFNFIQQNRIAYHRISVLMLLVKKIRNLFKKIDHFCKKISYITKKNSHT